MTTKLSVSVADDLWEQAQAQAPAETAASPSALVQAALRAFVGTNPPETARLRVTRPDGHKQTFERARIKLAQQAREEAERGYVAGLAIAEHLEWNDLERLAERFRFDIEAWARSYRDAAERADMRAAGYEAGHPDEVAPREQLMQHLIVNLGNFASPHDAESWTPSPTYLRSVRQALGEMYLETMAAADSGGDTGDKT
jgi:hypothetical protein